MSKKRVTRIEDEWKKEHDADTLREYEEIIKDPNRLRGALAKAKEMKADMEKRISALGNVIHRERGMAKRSTDKGSTMKK